MSDKNQEVNCRQCRRTVVVNRALSQGRCDVCHTQDYGAIWVRSVIYPQAFLFQESYPQISLPVVTRRVQCAALALARNVVTTHGNSIFLCLK